VGDDVAYTERIFLSLGLHPNVGGVLVVSLGCETVQGLALAETMSSEGGAVKFVGIQSAGGTSSAVVQGRAALEELRADASHVRRSEGEVSDVVVGIDDASAPFGPALVELGLSLGFQVVLPDGSAAGPTCHADLAYAGAQVIVSWCAPGEAAMGFPICPVVSVTGDFELHQAMPEEFDVLVNGKSNDDVAAIVWQSVVEVFNGRETASESQGSSDLLLRRMARSM
jgi:altronate dehydratase